MTIQDARERAEKFITQVQQRAESFTTGEGVVATQLRRALASQPAVAARGHIAKAWEKASAIDVEGYKAQAQGYKDQAFKAASARWESFSATPVGAQVKAAQEKVANIAKRWATTG